MEVTAVRAGWRSSTKAPGAPCVMTNGTPMMPMWCAGSLAVAGPGLLQEVPGLVRAQGPSSWMTCAAQGTSPTCGTAHTEAGTRTTVDMGRTPVSSAQVGLDHVWSPHGTVLLRTNALPSPVCLPEPPNGMPGSGVTAGQLAPRVLGHLLRLKSIVGSASSSILKAFPESGWEVPLAPGSSTGAAS